MIGYWSDVLDLVGEVRTQSSPAGQCSLGGAECRLCGATREIFLSSTVR